MKQRKGQPQIFFGRSNFSAAHALQLPGLRPAQTVMLTAGPPFAASKWISHSEKSLKALIEL